MAKRRYTALYISALAASLAISASFPLSPAIASAPRGGAVDALAKGINMPHSSFTLKNGLRVIVQTDRRVPVVAISLWYNVGSTAEPKGRSGFAHLFEHLMFSGSENAPGDFMASIQKLGAIEVNGTTGFDSTSYYQTVPTLNLDAALFLESDRMTHLIGAMTQEKLDNQRAVVKNEKRQGDNRPYRLVRYAKYEGLLPDGHPYQHDPIGSMADLDRASIDDVKAWISEHYVPNNAVLVLAGDIDVATAKKKVQKWFGAIPRGKSSPRAKIDIPTLPARKDIVLKDRVPQPRIYRFWTGPSIADPDRISLDVGANVLGDITNSRMYNALVRDEKLADKVGAFVNSNNGLSFFEISVDVKSGVDPAVVSKRLDELVADYIDTGPTQEEIDRAAIRNASFMIKSVEAPGGRGVMLAYSQLAFGKPDAFIDEMLTASHSTPTIVAAALKKWLSRPVMAVTVVSGDRDQDSDTEVKGGATGATAKAPAASDAAVADSAPSETHSATATSIKMPPIGEVTKIDFPAVQSATLSNGIKVHFVRRDTLPIVKVSLSFDAGTAADAADRLGVQSMMRAAMQLGTKSMNDIDLGVAQEKLGAELGSSASMDRTLFDLSALTVNLDPSLDLLTDVVRNPSFSETAVTLSRNERLAAIKQELSQPNAIASRTLSAAVFGQQHPYGRPSTGNGTAAVVGSLTPKDLADFHQAWIRPDKLEIFVAGKTTLAEITKKLEARFGNWKPANVAPGQKAFNASIPENSSRILLIDIPQSPQSTIYAGKVLSLRDADDLFAFNEGNKILGAGFLSRINKDLRQTKGWTYGARSTIIRNENKTQFAIIAPVQTDHTGDSIAALRGQVRDFLGDKGVTDAERNQTIDSSMRELPGLFLRADSVLRRMRNDALFNRPFNSVMTEPAKLKSLSAKDIDDAARRAIGSDAMTWVVVGDKTKILPQLQNLGLPIEEVEASK